MHSVRKRVSAAPLLDTPAVVPREQLVMAYRQMVLARLTDERIVTLYKQNKCFFQIGVAGHEAVQVAAAHVFRPGIDWFLPYYRDMALCSAIGMTVEMFMMNAMNKRDDPNSHGRQMPMHWGNSKLRIISQSSPTGSQFLHAVGCALSIKLKEAKEAVYVSCGEGACAQGDFHEALNWAARDRLPVVFLVENNGYAISVPVAEQLAGKSAAKIARGYENTEVFTVDGSDYYASLRAFQSAHGRALSGAGPALIEAMVPRLQSHSISDNQQKYRSAAELEQDKARCPISRMRELLISADPGCAKELEQIDAQVRRQIDRAVQWADNQSDCSAGEVIDHVYKRRPLTLHAAEQQPSGEELFMVEALNHVLDEELDANRKIYVFGQDVAGSKGGVFGVTNGLSARHGRERVFNSQLAESSIVGVAVGMALMGLKPVVEIQFADFIWTAASQIRSELATMLYRSAGDFSAPVVVRVPVGGYIHGGPYHSQSVEATFAHFPGLLIVYPSNATDAAGLLRSAIRCEDPVLFLEPKGLYRQPFAKGPIGDTNFAIPMGKAKVVRPGEDLTVVSWGNLVHKCASAAKEMEKEGHSVEVIDLRTIVPFDLEAVCASVRKTSRALVVHEDVRFMGFGAEIAAQIGEECFCYLDAPIRRLGMKPVPGVAHSPVLEKAVLPQERDVIEAMCGALAF